MCLSLSVGGVSTPRWRESSGAARATAGDSSDPSLPAHGPPAFLLGVLGSGQGGGRRGRGWSQPPSPTHGADGAEPQFNGSAFTANLN